MLAAAYAVEQRLGATRNLAVVAALADMRAAAERPGAQGLRHRDRLRRLPDLLRYLTAIERRLDRLTGNPQRDKQQQDRIAVVQKEYRELLAALPPARRPAAAVRQIRWMIEELRVNVFAQALGTPYPVSEQRIYRAMDDAEAT